MCEIKLILFKFFIVTASGFSVPTLSETDKNELWGALLRHEIGHNYSWTGLPLNSDSDLDKNLINSELSDDYKTIDNFNVDYPASSDHVKYVGDDGYVNDVSATEDLIFTNKGLVSDSTNENTKMIMNEYDSLKKLSADSEVNKLKSDSESLQIFDSKPKLKRADANALDLKYNVVSANDFDKFIPELMQISNPNDIVIEDDTDGVKRIKDLTKKIKSAKSIRPKPGQTSLVIVFDGTGSMENCLIQLRTGAKMIIEKFANRDDNPIFNYIFVPFRDPHIGPELVTTNQQELLDTLENLRLWGGGDCPESALNGILVALKYALPRSYTYIFTDAIAKDFGLDNEVLTLIQKKQTSLNFLLTGFCKQKDSEGYRVFERLAAASNGQVYNLKTQDIKDVLEDIKDSLDTRRVTLKYLDESQGNTHNIDLTVDNNLKEFSVSVAGHNPNITVTDPMKKIYEDGKEVLNLENIKVVNVQNPVSGAWNVKAESDSAHSVRLTALSDVNFNFGFSLKSPSKLSETLFNPLLGEYNILSILPSNTSRLSNLTNVQISLYYDKSVEESNEIKFNLTLMKIDKISEDDDDLYVTEPFQPPRQAFKIYINGFDEYGNPLQRLLSTVIQSTEESSPEIIIEPEYLEIDELDSISIKCHVQSQTPVTILWKYQKKILIEKESNQTTSIDFDVQSADPSHSGLYTCYAVNKRGPSEAKAEVKVNFLPLVVSIPEFEYQVIENGSLQIPCDVSRQSMEVQWVFQNKIINDNQDFESRDTFLTLKQAKRNHSGQYMCKARSFQDTDSDTTKVKVLFPAYIENQNVTEIKVKYYDPVRIACVVHGEPYPTQAWTFIPKIDGFLSNNAIVKENIEIESFKPENEGLYICEANNGIGNLSKWELNVTGTAKDSPSVENGNISTKISVKNGEEIILTCQCNLCKPLTNSSWTTDRFTFTQNDEQFDNMISIRMDILEDYQDNRVEYNLIISNISVGNSGLYICRLANENGADSLTYEVVVLSSPIVAGLLLTKQNQNDTSNEGPIIEGEFIIIDCFIEGSPIPVPTITWFKNGNTIDASSEIIAGDFTLVFTQINLLDTGVYTCRAENDIGVSEQNITVDIVVPPKIVTPIEHTQIANEGDLIILNCDVYGVPTPVITWTAHDSAVIDDPNKYTTVNNSLRFLADGEDSGIYECEATNPYGSISQHVILVIYVPPKLIVESDEIVELKTGDQANLICDATGYPRPTIFWYYERQEIISSTDLTVNGNELILKNVNVSNEGAYICEATNNVGSKQKIYFLVVNEAPKIISELPQEINLMPGENISLACRSSGNPTPKVSWSFLQNDTAQEVPEPRDILYISGDIPTMAGKYICKAENVHGIDTLKVFVIIFVPPQLILSPVPNNTLLNISLGSDVTLTCPFIKYNEITWLKDNKSLYQSYPAYHSPRYISKHRHQLPSEISMMVDEETESVEEEAQVVEEDRPENNLYIPYVASETSGNYTCLVKNEVGQGYFSYHLNVLSPPQILDNDDYMENNILTVADAKTVEMSVKSGERFLLECLANGNPEPMIEWKRNNVVISTNKQLRIDYATLTDSGIYKCVASNTEGSIEKEFNIDIITKPTYSRDAEQYFEVNEGNSLELNCLMQGNPPPKIKWTKNDEHLDNYQEILELSPVNISDSGIYRCIGENQLGYEQVLFHVLVFKRPSIVYITENTTFIQPNRLNLTCQATGSPTPIISWTHNGQLLISTARIHFAKNIFDNRNKSIFIDEHGNGISFPNDPFAKSNNNNNNDNNGNSTGTESIDNNWSPNLSPLSYLLVNSTISTMYAIAKYTGTKDEAITAAIELILPPETEASSTIAAPKAERQFTCVAINAVGKDEKHTFTRALVSPSVEGSHRMSSETIPAIEVLEGLPVILKCNSTGYPIPILHWFKDSIELRDTDNVRQMGFGKLLNILESSIDDTGIYCCLAKNIAGEREVCYNVSVLVPPKIRYNSTNLYENGDIVEKIIAKQGNNIQLHCPVVGNPMPNIIWTRIDYDQFNEETISVNSTKLHIRSIFKPTTYICFANSTFGEVRLLFHISVHKPPALASGDDPFLRVKNGHGFNLHCAVYAEPEPNITWYKDEEVIYSTIDSVNPSLNRYVSTDEQHMRIISSSKEDSGRYKCLAQNVLGIVKKVFNVEIYNPVHWSPWGFWTACSTTCGYGIRKRKRICLQSNGRYATEDDSCVGESSQTQSCELSPCPINGGWGDWSTWSQCTLSCVEENNTMESIRERWRLCDFPEPGLGGKPCVGSHRQKEICNVPYCPVDGRWSNWSSWSSCSASCGAGTKIRFRKCNNPPAMHGGAYCDGANVESATCFVASCAIHGGWSDWSPWSVCSQKCGRGQKYRKRECNNPTPMNGGNLCEGTKFETKMCKERNCRNSNLVKNLGHQKYTPLLTIPVKSSESYEEKDNEREYDSDEYLESKPVHFVPAVPFTESREYLEEDLSKPQKVIIRVENVIPVGDDVAQISVNFGRPVTLNQLIKCSTGYELKGGICQDIDECKYGHSCSHYCVNIPGSYQCQCPLDMDLEQNGRQCVYLAKHNRPQRDHPIEFVKYAEMVCSDGYFLKDEICYDTDECQEMTDDCGEDQTCLNTKGSHMCVSTPCPRAYKRDELSGQCVQICTRMTCTDGAKIAQTISYTVLSLRSDSLKLPILKLVNYDINQTPLSYTKFSFLNKINTNEFLLKSFPEKSGIVYLYGSEFIQREKVHTLTIVGESYDQNYDQLLYVTRFIIYIYVI